MRLSHYYPAVNTNISPIVFTSHLASVCLVYNEIAQAPPSNVFSTSVISTGSTGLSQSFHIPQCIQSTHNKIECIWTQLTKLKTGKDISKNLLFVIKALGTQKHHKSNKRDLCLCFPNLQKPYYNFVRNIMMRTRTRSVSLQCSPKTMSNHVDSQDMKCSTCHMDHFASTFLRPHINAHDIVFREFGNTLQ